MDCGTEKEAKVTAMVGNFVVVVVIVLVINWL